jgi:transposase
MNHAVNVDEIIKTVLDGKGIRAATMLTDRHFGFGPTATANEVRSRQGQAAARRSGCRFIEWRGKRRRCVEAGTAAVADRVVRRVRQAGDELSVPLF